MSKSRKQASRPSEEDWFLVYCSKDTSYSLLQRKDVVCDPTVSVGDEVVFSFNKKTYQGIVEKIAGKDHFELMKAEQDRLNAQKNKKKPESFHEENPRKAALKSKAQLKQLSSRRKDSTHEKKKKFASTDDCSNTSSLPNTDQSLQDGEMGEDQGGNLSLQDLPVSFAQKDSQEDSSDDSCAGLSPTELKQYKQLKRKMADAKGKEDIKALKKIKESEKVRPLPDVSTDNPREKSSSIVVASTSKVSEHITNSNIEENSKSNSESSDSENDVSHSPDALNINLDDKMNNSLNEAKMNAPVKSFYFKLKKNLSQFEGTMFLKDVEPPKDSVKEKFVPIDDSKEVFCKEDSLRSAKQTCRTASSFARKLMDGIFSEEALAACSLTGDKFKGARSPDYTQRPPLDQDAVTAIVDLAIKRQTKKKWEPAMDVRSIKSSMSSKLSERRSEKRYAPKSSKEDD